MFQPWKSDNGAVLPWEYLPAEAGTYHVGQALNLDAIHDTVHEMARDEARHGKAFEGLLKRCFSAHKPSLSTF